jgi:hypothetical protein
MLVSVPILLLGVFVQGLSATASNVAYDVMSPRAQPAERVGYRGTALDNAEQTK